MNGLEVRKATHGAYLIFYVVFDGDIQIVRIIHGSRDWMPLVGM